MKIIPSVYFNAIMDRQPDTRMAVAGGKTGMARKKKRLWINWVIDRMRAL